MKLFTPKYVDIRIVERGAPVVDNGIVYRKGKTVVALALNMRSKYCTVCAKCGISDGIPGIIIEATDESLHLDNTKKGADTFIEFPEYKGWSVHSADGGRYTVSVCLVRDKE